MVTEEKEIDWNRLIAREGRWQRSGRNSNKDPANAGKKTTPPRPQQKTKSNTQTNRKRPVFVEEEDDDDELYPAYIEENHHRLLHDQVDDKQDPLASMWLDWDAEIQAERRRVPDLIKYEDIDVLIDSCDHEFIFREDCGKVCEICGRVVQLVSDIFDVPVPAKKEPSKPKKKLRFHEDYALELDVNGSNIDVDVDLVPHAKHIGRMYPHQREAFTFMSYNLLATKPGGVILHHAPGTGKTFLVISFLTSFFAKFPTKRAMILAPKGMLSRWQEEFRKWEAESINVSVLEGGDSVAVYRWASESGVLVMTPQLLAGKLAKVDIHNASPGDEPWILAYKADVLVFDEAHYARNDNTKIAAALMAVKTPRRIFLSGTVFQNNLDELYNLFMLCRPSFLAPAMEQFALEDEPGLKDDPEKFFFKKMVDSRLESDLRRAVWFFRKLTAPFLHWYDGKVLDALPGIEEVVVVLDLSDEHKALLFDPAASSGGGGRGFLAEDSKFARACIHPCLARDLDNPRIELQDPKAGSKTGFVIELLQFLRKNKSKEKVIVFGQYMQPLNLLKQMISERLGWREGKEILHMTGDTRHSGRAQICRDFNSKRSIARVILVSIKACGEGISLVGGSRVVMLDTAWNPSTVRQAVSRAFRIGQEQKVFVYRLLVGNIPEHEEEKLKRSLQKDFLAMALFDPEMDVAEQEAGVEQVLGPVETTQDEFLKPFLCEESKRRYCCDGVYHLPSMKKAAAAAV